MLANTRVPSPSRSYYDSQIRIPRKIHRNPHNNRLDGKTSFYITCYRGSQYYTNRGYHWSEGVPGGLVDIDDVIFVAIRFGLVKDDPGWDPRADITGPEYLVPDGLVDIVAVILVAVHFGEHL